MFKLQTPERLKFWRQFRDKINEVEFEGALFQTEQLWNKAPFTPFYLDIEHPEDWPDPWTLVVENYYCDIAKALGIIYTIALSNHGKDVPIEFRMYYDKMTHAEYNLAVFDQGKYVVNFRTGEIVNIDTLDAALQLKHVYSTTVLKLNEI
jgi:hypothetical protein